MDLPRVSGTNKAVNSVPNTQMAPYKKKVPDWPNPSSKSTKVLAMMKPQRKAKQMMMELAILRTLGGSNSAVKLKKVQNVRIFLK